MQPDANTTYVVYRLVRAGGSMNLSIQNDCHYAPSIARQRRGYADGNAASSAIARCGVRGGSPFYVLSDHGAAHPPTSGITILSLSAEKSRGSPITRHFFAGKFTATLGSGITHPWGATTNASASLNAKLLMGAGEATLSLLKISMSRIGSGARYSCDDTATVLARTNLSPLATRCCARRPNHIGGYPVWRLGVARHDDRSSGDLPFDRTSLDSAATFSKRSRTL